MAKFWKFAQFYGLPRDPILNPAPKGRIPEQRNRKILRTISENGGVHLKTQLVSSFIVSSIWNIFGIRKVIKLAKLLQIFICFTWSHNGPCNYSNSSSLFELVSMVYQIRLFVMNFKFYFNVYKQYINCLIESQGFEYNSRLISWKSVCSFNN